MTSLNYYAPVILHILYRSVAKQAKNKNKDRCLFGIKLPIFSDFPMTKCMKTPISLKQHLLTRYARTHTKSK